MKSNGAYCGLSTSSATLDEIAALVASAIIRLRIAPSVAGVGLAWPTQDGANHDEADIGRALGAAGPDLAETGGT